MTTPKSAIAKRLARSAELSDKIVYPVWNPRARAAADRTEAEISKVWKAFRKCMENDATIVSVWTDPGRLAFRYRKLVRKYQLIYLTGSCLNAVGE